MGSIVIVALPSEDDYVWKLSSEKVPHMTLLFLGDEVENIGHVVEFVQHASKNLSRFGGSVTRRGLLGPDEADVLFFEKAYLNSVNEFRTHLLTEPNINKAYNSADQYPEWTPHLTMGYPETPAHEDKREYPGCHWVNFNRIAIWTEDYAGPAFFLESDDRALSMSEQVESFLAHYGVKGMRWGVRKDNSPTSVSIKEIPGRRVKTSGGENQSAHPDAIRSATAKQIAKKSTTDALSTKDLQEMVNRMNLEQNYRRLTQTDGPAKRAQKAVKELLGIGKTYNEVVNFTNSPGGQKIAEAIRKKKAA